MATPLFSRKWIRAIVVMVVISLLCEAGALTSPVRADDSAATQHFEKRVRPLLIAQCVKCHGVEKAESGLRLDHGAGTERGGDSGAVIRAGKPDESLLIQAVRQTGDLTMLPGKKLLDAEIRDLETWVRNGAKWPTDSNAGKRDSRSLIEQAKATLGERTMDANVRAKGDKTGERLDAETKATIDRVQREFYPAPGPAATSIRVSGFAFEELLIEIEAFAICRD